MAPIPQGKDVEARCSFPEHEFPSAPHFIIGTECFQDILLAVKIS